MGSILRSNYVAPEVVARCRDCGESLDDPHVLGAHLPGCSKYPRSPIESLDPEEDVVHHQGGD